MLEIGPVTLPHRRPPMTSENARREPRIDLDLDVTLKLPEGDAQYAVGDASFRGVFLRTADPLPLRKLVRFRTTLPGDDEPLQMMGLVAHHISPAEAEELDRDPGMGIHLFSVGEQTHRRWRRFVRERYEEDPEARQEFKRLEFPHVVAHLPSNEELETYFDDDLASGEMFVRSSEVHPTGTEVICDIVHSDGAHALDLEGIVDETVKSPPRQRGMTIRFPELDDEDRRRVRAFSESRLEDVERRPAGDDEAGDGPPRDSSPVETDPAEAEEIADDAAS